MGVGQMFEYRVQLYESRVEPNKLNCSLNKFIQMIGRKQRVLEVGCATGYLSAYLTQQMECEVVGIEFNIEAARKAEGNCSRVICADVEKDAFDKVTGLFDVITFGDVLEHLVCPGAVLLRSRDFLREGGYILVSIPNIAHYSARLDLLLGKFEYQQYGLLDRTHLRFFTLGTARQFLEDAGYVIDDFDSVYIMRGMRFIQPHGRLERFLKKHLAGLIGYQFIFKASKRNGRS